jgi:NaMN:DMB phosphoribosyltransferase
VLLAGGSQMLAVAALIAAIGGPDALHPVVVGTTRWIIADPAADVVGLASEIAPRLPILAVNLDFARSRHSSLHAYERFMVKEGVGAGGTCVAAVLASGASIERLEAVIDDAYDEVAAPLRTLDAG